MRGEGDGWMFIVLQCICKISKWDELGVSLNLFESLEEIVPNLSSNLSSMTSAGEVDVDTAQIGRYLLRLVSSLIVQCEKMWESDGQIAVQSKSKHSLTCHNCIQQKYTF